MLFLFFSLRGEVSPCTRGLPIQLLEERGMNKEISRRSLSLLDSLILRIQYFRCDKYSTLEKGLKSVLEYLSLNADLDYELSDLQ